MWFSNSYFNGELASCELVIKNSQLANSQFTHSLTQSITSYNQKLKYSHRHRRLLTKYKDYRLG